MKTLLTIALSLSALSWSQAAITYVNPEPDISIPTSFGGIYLNLITAGETSSMMGGSADPSGDSYTISFSEPPSGDWDINFFFGGAGIAHNTSLQPYRSSDTDNLSAVDNLTIKQKGSEAKGSKREGSKRGQDEIFAEPASFATISS